MTPNPASHPSTTAPASSAPRDFAADARRGPRDILVETRSNGDASATASIASISDQDWHISRTHGVYHIPARAAGEPYALVTAGGDRARRRTRMGLCAHPFRRLPRMRRKGEAQRSSLQTLRRNPRRRKSREARPRRQQRQRREPRHTSTTPTNATVGARHAVPGKRTWRNRAVHAVFSSTGIPACATRRYMRGTAKARQRRRRSFEFDVSTDQRTQSRHSPSIRDRSALLRWHRPDCLCH